MSRRLPLFTVLFALVGGAFVAGLAVSDEPPAMPKEMEEMMQEWMRLKTPGPQHELLKGLQGTWVGTGTWTEMGMSSKFTEEATSKLVYDGRFLQTASKMTSEAAGGMPAMSMSSLMFLGYDNAREKYTMAMVGDWSTSIGAAEGTYDAATKTLTMTGVEVMGAGRERTFRMVQTLTSADAWTFEMFFTPPGGEEAKAGEAVYKRKQSSSPVCR
jgi:hypothetical protein